MLHVFQKMSKKGFKTPQHDPDLIRNRLATAKSEYEELNAAHEQTPE